MDAWVCPKCGRVWGPFVMQCSPCNFKASGGLNGYAPPQWVPPIKRATTEMRY